MTPAVALRAGLVIAAVLGLADLALPIAGGGEFPPMPVAIASAALGLVTIVAVVVGWRGNRVATGTVIAARTLSALGAVPAFFAGGVPAAAPAAAALTVAVTVVCVVLLALGLRRTSAAQPAHP
jgi:O-antigen/teichoic acid export membrane protein